MSKSMNQITLCPFRTISAPTFSASVATVVAEFDLVLANLGARAVAVGSAFEYFRFKKLNAYQYTTTCGPIFDADAAGGTGVEGPLSADHHLAFIESNAALTGTATNIGQMSQYEIYRGGSVYEKLKVKIPKSLLAANAYKWFNTASTGAASDDLSPGMFISATTNTLSYVAGWEPTCRLVIEGVLEFRGMITPALSFDKLNTLDTQSNASSSVNVFNPSSASYDAGSSGSRKKDTQVTKRAPSRRDN